MTNLFSDTILKGGISNVHYVWRCEKGENTCEVCKALDGKEFDMYEEVPERPHPNCRCTVDIVEDKEENNNNNKWIMPVPKGHKITSGYGNRMHPIHHRIIFHDGIDINAKENTPVYAVTSGTVIKAEWFNGYGNYIEIDHGNGIHSFYGHLNKINVNKGNIITQGETIALSGNTGAGTAAHLHFGVHKNGSSVNPLDYLPNFE